MPLELNLAAVSSNHVVKQERGVTSARQEATIASNGHRNNLALVKSSRPGCFSVSHSAKRENNSPRIPPSEVVGHPPVKPADNQYATSRGSILFKTNAFSFYQVIKISKRCWFSLFLGTLTAPAGSSTTQMIENQKHAGTRFELSETKGNGPDGNSKSFASAVGDFGEAAGRHFSTVRM